MLENTVRAIKKEINPTLMELLLTSFSYGSKSFSINNWYKFEILVKNINKISIYSTFRMRYPVDSQMLTA